LVEVVAGLCGENGIRSPRIVDICTGSGAVSFGISKLVPESRVTAVDISAGALCVARENAGLLGFDNIEFALSDMFSFFGESRDRFDVVVSNPPYVSAKDYEMVDDWVKQEPKEALLSGAEGMDHIKVLIAESSKYLKTGGFLAMEVGYDQGVKTRELLEKAGYSGVKSFRDFSNYERIIIGRKNG
jgi:release factor glutamine methyltransferase